MTRAAGTWSSGPDEEAGAGEEPESPLLVTVVRMMYFDVCFSDKLAVCRTGSSNWTYRRDLRVGGTLSKHLGLTGTNMFLCRDDSILVASPGLFGP